MPEKQTFFAGLDLGQSADYTAFCVLERLRTDAGVAVYHLRHLERFPLGTAYPTIVETIVSAFSTPPLSGSVLVVDQTGVGRPVVDMLRKARPKAIIKPILITSGHAVSQEGAGWHVPKKELVSEMQALLQGKRLQILKSLPFTNVLVKELETFRVKLTPAGNEQFESWREKDHDDLVLAVALAAWVAERGQKRLWIMLDGEVVRSANPRL